MGYDAMTADGRFHRHLGAALLVSAGIALGGCALSGSSNGSGAAVDIAIENNKADDRGVITYANYQVMVVRSGDTMETAGARAGISAAELASRNSLPVTYTLRPGEILLLPDSVARPDGSTQASWSAEQASSAIDDAGKPAPIVIPPKSQSDPGIDPVRHRVEAGETAYSIARLYGVSVTALASWNGLGPDLLVRTNQELLIPVVSSANKISSAPLSEPGQVTKVTPPPSASAALPANINTGPDPTSPDLGQYRTPPGGRLKPPVAAKVSRAYNPANPAGVAYAVPAGTPVRAAGAGEVALVSEAQDGNGAIVLIRHQDDLMTTYSVLQSVSVKKGQKVSAGQLIGAVAPRDNPELQFDVFRGTTSVDPTPYIGG
jgi:murein DD-endopeptidase MepM/ murein hydrolase activator NlpD